MHRNSILTLYMYLLSRLINVMHPCLIKVLFILKILTKSNILNGKHFEIPKKGFHNDVEELFLFPQK